MSLSLKGGLARDEVIQGCTETVNVAGRPDLRPAALRLLGAHEGRRADRGAHLRFGAARLRRRAQGHLGGRLRCRVVAADDLGQSPVDHQGLAVRTEQDVRRLEVAMDHAAAMGIGDRMTDVDIARQELAEGQCALGRVALRLSSGSRGSRRWLP